MRWTRRLSDAAPVAMRMALAAGFLVAEIVLGVALLAGVRVRLATIASGVLLLIFAIAMTTALGPEAPLP